MAVLLEDHGDSLDNWGRVEHAPPVLVEKDPRVGHAPYLAMRNGVAHAPLSSFIVGGRLTLRIKMLHAKPLRHQSVWLLDEEGRRGYGFHWLANKGDRDQVRLAMLDQDAQLAFKDQGKPLSEWTSVPGHPAEAPFAEFEFSWEAETGQIQLRTLGKDHGPVSVAANNTEFKRFSRVYLRGNETGYFDDIVVRGTPGKARPVVQVRPLPPAQELSAGGSIVREAGKPIAARGDEFAAMSLPQELEPIPRIDCPLYLMEYHIWWLSPFGEGGIPGYIHWGPSVEADVTTMGPSWMRHNRSAGHPLLGLYSATDPHVMRWQIRCARNAGIDAMFVMHYPDRATGLSNGGEHIFKLQLGIAAEERFKLAAHDEVHFRRGWKAQEPEVMAERAGQYIKKYGRHLGYLRIKGKPVYHFQFYGRFQGKMSNEDLQAMIRRAEEVAGEPISFMINHDPGNDLYALPETSCFTGTGASCFIFQGTEGYHEKGLRWDALEKRLANVRQARQKFPDKVIGLWGYAGFENSSLHPRDETTAWIPRRGGLTLVETIRRFVKEAPDFVLLSSWNDWIENTALEPGLSYEGFNGDPYLYCRIMAAMKGKRLVPPPLPPKESVDPLMWEPLYGIDRTPPKIVACRYLPMDPGLVVTAADSGSAVKQVLMAYRGDVCAEFGANEIKLRGVASLKPMPKGLPKQGLILRPRESLEITLAPKPLEGQREAVFLALEFADEGKGRIDIRYSADPPIIDYQEMDHTSFPVRQLIDLNGKGGWRTAVRRLRAFDLKADPIVLTLTLDPPRGEKSPGAVRLARLHLFRDAREATGGIEISHVSAESQMKVYRLKTPNLKGEPPSAAYLLAEDAEGNRSVPFAAFGADYHPTGIRP